MYGFLITRNMPPQEMPLENPQKLSYGDVHFYYSPLPRFENDHLFLRTRKRSSCWTV